MDEAAWVDMIQNFANKYACFAGKPSQLYFHANQHDHERYRGVS